MSPFHEVDHLSYSSLSTYTACPRSFYLSRNKRAEGLPAWYFIIGSAFHDWVRDYLSSDLPPRPIEDYFNDEVEKANDLEPDMSLWLHGGSDDEPVVEERALRLAQVCTERAVDFLQDFEVWGVEIEVTGYLPGCSMPIMGFVDILGEHKKHGPAIVDWKTGKTKPKDNLQLETYNGLIMTGAFEYFRYTPEPVGLWAMLNPDAAKARPVRFKHTPESLGAIYGGVEKQITGRKWKPEPQFNCKFCNMRPNCKTMSGSNQRTRYYDTPVADKGFPF